MKDKDTAITITSTEKTLEIIELFKELYNTN